MVTVCLAMIGIALVISCPLTWVMRAVAGRLGQLDAPGERKIHTRPTPVTGGVAIFWGIVGPIVAGLIAVWAVPEATWAELLPAVGEHITGMRAQTPLAIALVVCLGVLHAVGVWDDRKNLGPYGKLIVQVVAAAVLVIFFDVRLLDALGPVPAIVLSIVWIVTVTNAFNFLDNMDGLSGGIATICAAILLAAALISGQYFVAAVLGLVVGALLGFLVFNFPPATIFMGDGGSLVVGFIVAFCAMRVTYFDAGAGSHWFAVLTPVVVLAIPLYDITSVTLIRIAQGKSPFKGDTQHFSHRLVRKGLSRRAAVIVIWMCTLATGLGGVMLGRLEPWQAGLVAAQTVAILTVLAMLERTGNSKSDQP